MRSRLYELIKNGVDAGSKRIEISAQILLTHGAYIAALDDLEEGAAVEDVFANVVEQLVPGTTDEVRAPFLKELRTASGDRAKFAKALAAAYGRHNWIEVRDVGEGMSLAQLNDVYLTVGTRSRRAQNIAGGDKGVGRLSAMRLGDRLHVSTTTERDANWNLLDINWALFTHETVRPLDEIDVKAVLGQRKEKRSEHGTVLKISELNADWHRLRFVEVFQGQRCGSSGVLMPGRRAPAEPATAERRRGKKNPGRAG